MTKVTVIGGSVVDVITHLPKRFLRRQIQGASLVLPFGAKLEAQDYTISAGGSGANVATGLTRLGLAVHFFTEIGNDLFATYLQETLEKEGMVLTTKAYPNSTNLSVILRIPPDRTIITAHRSPNEYLKQKLPGDGWIHLGPLPGDEERFYQELLAHIVKTDQRFSLNPSYEALANRNRYFLAALKQASVLILNYDEASCLARLPGKPEAQELAHALIRLGPKVVCVTCGEKGAVVTDGDTYLSARALLPDDPDEIDATGAGDAFTAGFVASFIKHHQLLGKDSLEKALGWGIVNSASVVAQIGAQEGLLSEAKLLKDLSAVNIRQL